MDIFMDKNSVIGIWLAYFENTRLCKVQACKDGFEEIKMAARKLPDYINAAHIDW